MFHSIAECATYTKNMQFDGPLRKFCVQLLSADVGSTFPCHGFQWKLVGAEKKKKGRQDTYNIRLTDLRTKKSCLMPTMNAAFAETQLQDYDVPKIRFDIIYHLSGFKFELLGRGETFQVGSRNRRQVDKTVPASDAAVKPPVKDVVASLQDDAEEVMEAEVTVDEWNSPTAEYKTPKTIRNHDDIVLRDRALQLPAIVYCSLDMAGKNLFLRYCVDTLCLNPKSMLVRFPPNNNGYKQLTGCTHLGKYQRTTSSVPVFRRILILHVFVCLQATVASFPQRLCVIYARFWKSKSKCARYNTCKETTGLW